MISSDIRRRPEDGWPDEFGRRPLATAYADMLMNIPQEQDPVVAAVFGTWGSGKTRFCRFVAEHIEATRPGTRVLWFEPWKYASRQDLDIPTL